MNIWTGKPRKNGKGPLKLNTPFQAYRTERTQSFPSWLLEPEKYNSKKTGNWNEEGNIGYYGERTKELPGNLINYLYSLKGANIEQEGRTGKQKRKREQAVLKQLKALKKEMLTQENNLYQSLGIKTFSEFKLMWDSENLDKTDSKYWLNRKFKLMEGQNQRIFASYDFTSIQQLFNLVSAEVYNLGQELNVKIEGAFSSDEKKKISACVDDLLVPEEQIKANGQNYAIRPLKKGVTDSQLLTRFAEIYGNERGAAIIKELEEQVAQSAGEAIQLTLEQMFAAGFYRLTAKHPELMNSEIKRALKSLTVNINRSQKPKKNREKAITKEEKYYKALWSKRVATYISKVFEDTLTFEERKEYDSYKSDVERKFEEIVECFFRDYGNKYVSTDITANRITFMGILGELANYGRLRTNIMANNKLSSRRIEVISSGTKKFNGKSMAQDLVFTVVNDDESNTAVTGKNYIGRQYGIQVKNPFTTTNGIYDTYEQKWDLANKKSRQQLYELYLGLTDEKDQTAFELINLNLTNTTTPERFESALEGFFYLCAPAFMRLSEQSLAEPIANGIENIGVNNIFFVLMGELIQGSDLLEGLIQQYKVYLGQEVNNASTSFLYSYQNSIPENVHSVYNSDGTFNEWAFQANEDWVNYGEGKNNLFDKITLRTGLRLKIPSINKLVHITK